MLNNTRRKCQQVQTVAFNYNSVYLVGFFFFCFVLFVVVVVFVLLRFVLFSVEEHFSFI